MIAFPRIALVALLTLPLHACGAGSSTPPAEVAGGSGGVPDGIATIPWEGSPIAAHLHADFRLRKLVEPGQVREAVQLELEPSEPGVAVSTRDLRSASGELIATVLGVVARPPSGAPIPLLLQGHKLVEYNFIAEDAGRALPAGRWAIDVHVRVGGGESVVRLERDVGEAWPPTPELTAPVDGADGVALVPTLTWSPLGVEAQVDLQLEDALRVQNEPPGTREHDGIYGELTGAATSFTVPADRKLAPNRQYQLEIEVGPIGSRVSRVLLYFTTGAG